MLHHIPSKETKCTLEGWDNKAAPDERQSFAVDTSSLFNNVKQKVKVGLMKVDVVTNRLYNIRALSS